MQVTDEQRRIRDDLVDSARRLNGDAAAAVRGLFPRRGDLDMVRRKIRGADVTVNFRPSADLNGRPLVDVLFESDHYMNRHETGYGAGTDLAFGRDQFEAAIGYQPIRYHSELEASDKQERPRYAALNIFTSGAGAAPAYGGAALVLHPDLLGCSTLTLRDSVSMTYFPNFINGVGTIDAFDHCITWQRVNYPSSWDEWSAGLIRVARGMADPWLETNVHFYAEVQIHGVVEFPGDVLYLRANFQSEFGTAAGTRLQHWARRNGWSLVWGMGNEMVIDPTVEFPTVTGDDLPRPIWTDALLANAALFRDIWDNLAQNAGTANTWDDWAVLWNAVPPAARYVPSPVATVPLTMTELRRRLLPLQP